MWNNLVVSDAIHGSKKRGPTNLPQLPGNLASSLAEGVVMQVGDRAIVRSDPYEGYLSGSRVGRAGIVREVRELRATRFVRVRHDGSLTHRYEGEYWYSATDLRQL